MIKHVRFIIFSMLFLNIFFVYSQENLDIRIDQIQSSQYPEIRAYAVIKNSKGEIVSGLSPSLFSFRIDSGWIILVTTGTKLSASQLAVPMLKNLRIIRNSTHVPDA